MKILLIGEYSNVHNTLAQGLRTLGHEATVISNGDNWKNYPRDINLSRRSLGHWDTLRYLWDVKRLWPKLRNYDVVQLINPVFLDLKAERILPYYEQLRSNNGKLFLGAFGIDKPWVEEGMKADTFRYSDFFIYNQPRQYPEVEDMQRDWLHGPKGVLNDYIAKDCNGIIAGLYEYYISHQARYAQKTTFIPFPINHALITPSQIQPQDSCIRFFIGIQRQRSRYKGTDVMLNALEALKKRYAQQMQINRAENIPFAQYQQMMDHSDVLLDQLYSYTPAMNALLAMAKGLVVVGGGEEEHYQLLGEQELRPIINVQPSQQSVEEEIQQRLLQHPDDLGQLKHDSTLYTRKHHDHIRIAQQYINYWNGH